MPFDLSTAVPMQQQAMPQNLTGEDYLKTLPPTAANLIKKYALGELPVTGQMVRTPAGQQLLGAITQYDPTFDATNYQKRQQTANAFAKGLEAKQVKGANQALYHMGSLYKSVEDLNNLNILPGILNKPLNYIEEKLGGDTRQGAYRENAHAVAAELRKVFAGQGGGSLAELNKWEDSFDPNAGENQQKAYIKKGVHLLNGGIEALNEQYRKGMGLNKDINLLDPDAQVIYNQLLSGEQPKPYIPKTSQQKLGNALIAPVKIANDAEYEKLSPGQSFIGPDNVKRTKPR